MNLTQFCGGEEFFDWNKILNSSTLKFSHCFEHTVFDLTPCFFIVVFGIPYFLVHYSSSESCIPKSKLFFCKLVFTLVLSFMSSVNLFHAMSERSSGAQVADVDVVSPIFVAIGMVLAACFIHFDRLKGVRSSSLLSCFWLLYLVTWAFVFKTQVELLHGEKAPANDDKWRRTTFFISYLCVVAHFLLSFFVDGTPSKALHDSLNDQTNSTFTFHDQQLQAAKMRLKPCPEHSSSFFSQMTFEWFTSTIWQGYKRPLVDDDLCDLNKADKAGRISKKFMKIWNEEKAKFRHTRRSESVSAGVHGVNSDEEVLVGQRSGNNQNGPSLLKALIKTFGPYFLLSTLLKVLNDILTFVSPQLLRGLIGYSKSETASAWQGYLLAVLLFVTAIFQSVVLQQYFHVCFVSGMRLRAGLVAAIYKKTIVLSNFARSGTNVGEVVNLMAVDAQRFMDLMSYVNIIWSGPFQIMLAMHFLWQTMGPSTLAGLGVMILLLPVNAYIADKAHKLQVVQMKEKDRRIRMMSEILNGIKVLKLYAWELAFRDKVTDIRDKELEKLRSAAYLSAAASFTWTCAPFLVSLTTFAVYVSMDKHNVLDAEKAFVSIALFNILQFPLIMLPMMVSSLGQAKVSLDRLWKFLTNEELDPGNVEHSSGPGPAISIQNASFSWNDDVPTLRNISLNIKRGSLVAIVGQVGSGKSSLISSILGEMEKLSGTVSVKGSIAYVAQQPWLQNMSVRENILFGKPLEPRLYIETVEACGLREEFVMLPAGDRTEIGDRGINLSGGQKQRLSIARAVYSNAQIYLFDDPLSAVDPHVGKYIFNQVLGPKGCLRSKTRVLVTHGVAYLPQMDQIIVLWDGRVSEVGNFAKLLAKDGDFAEFLRNHANTDDFVEDDDDDCYDEHSIRETVSSVTDDDALEPAVQTEINAAAVARRQYQRQQGRQSIAETVVLKRRNKPEKTHRGARRPTQSKQPTSETVATGNMKMADLISYIRSVGLPVCIFIALMYLISNGLAVYSSIWLSDWTSDPVNPDGTQNSTLFRLQVYGMLGVSRAFFVLFSSFFLSFGSILASSRLHLNMLDRVVRAPMAFFNTTSLGRIINRFSKDIFMIDEVVPRSLAGFTRTFFMTLATFAVIIYSTPLFAAVVLPIFLLYWFVQRFYIRTSRQLKRLESISRSPIYSHFSETLAGVSTIRAFDMQKHFFQQNEMKIDINQMTYFPNIISNRWLALRLEIVGNLIVLFAAIFAVIQKGKIHPGIVGLSISYALQVTSIMNWVVRTASEVETNIVSIERIEEYAKVDQEAPLIVESSSPPDDWPRTGEILFQGYSTRYRPGLELVIRNITMDIRGGEKVGVVGRTGAGKSSLTLALFRIMEAAEGKIAIDGLDISKIGLHSLRSRLSIIPQDPVLFSGTLRMNLDPFDSYTDIQVWDALDHSHLKTFVTSLADKLEHPISMGGENLSAGQRQLVCLARALLRKSKILILDEATAAVDLETDDLIQAAIRAQFPASTVFIVAHRLKSIMDCSRVLVIDAGRIVEYDNPGKLLNARGVFYSMARDAGLA